MKKLAIHMKHLGLCLLGSAIENIFYGSLNNPYLKAFGVLHAAQAGEIIIKSCIAKEHPLLIFNKIPKLSKYSKQNLKMEQLLEKGQTLNYSELPDVLWASTGYIIAELELYRKFGKLRNIIQHLAVPKRKNLSKETLLFACKVIDPMTQHFWKIGIFEGMIVDDEFIYTGEGLKTLLKNYGISYNGWLPTYIERKIKEKVKEKGTDLFS